MKAQDKELLLKDLCARLPYGVQCEVGGRLYGPYTFVGDDVEDLMEGRTFKPYLRPMSTISSLITAKELSSLSGIELIDWYNANHIDYRGLIEKGLAIEVTEENNPYKD